MAERITGRTKIVASDAVHPEYMDVVHTYVQHAGIEFQRVAFDSVAGVTLIDSIDGLDEKTAAVVVQSPIFWDVLRTSTLSADRAHALGALLIVVVTEAISLGLLRAPGACGADIVVAKASLLVSLFLLEVLTLALFATKDKYARQIPGRLVGEAF